MANTVGDMSRSELSRFVQQAITLTPASLPKSLQGEEIESTLNLIISGDVKLSPKAVASLKTYLGLP